MGALWVCDSCTGSPCVPPVTPSELRTPPRAIAAGLVKRVAYGWPLAFFFEQLMVPNEARSLGSHSP